MSEDCEAALTNTGRGPCHSFLIGLCSACSLAEAGVSFFVVVIIPLVACDLNLNKKSAISMHAVLSFGMAVGAFLFGSIADMNGRKGSIPATMAIVFCGSVSLAFAQSAFLINFSIFIVGLGLSGNNTTLRVYLIECLPMKKRGCYLVVLDLIWTVGYVSAIGISWTLVPSAVRMQSKVFRPSSWRVLIGVGAAPCLVVACLVGLLPSSPRYALYRERYEEALMVLRQIYAINTSKHVDTYPAIDLENSIQPDTDDDEDSNTSCTTLRLYFSKTMKRLREIKRMPFKRITIFSALASLLHFPGFIWFVLWNARLLREMDKSNSDCNVDAETTFSDILSGCRDANRDRFIYILLISLSYVFGEMLLACGIDFLGRKFFLGTFGFIGCAMSLFISAAPDRATRILFSAILLASYAVALTTTSIMILENYPTRLRGTAAGLLRVLPHIIGFFTKLLTRVPCLSSTITISGIFLIGAVIAIMPLPDLTRAPMRE